MFLSKNLWNSPASIFNYQIFPGCYPRTSVTNGKGRRERERQGKGEGEIASWLSGGWTPRRHLICSMLSLNSGLYPLHCWWYWCHYEEEIVTVLCVNNMTNNIQHGVP